MSLISDEEFALIAAAANNVDQLRAKVTLLIAVKSLESEAEAIRDDSDRLAQCDVNPALVHGFRTRADTVAREAAGFRGMLEGL